MAILLIIVFLVIGYLMLNSTSKSKDIANSSVSYIKPQSSKKKEIQYNNERWLKERWMLAQEHKLPETNSIFQSAIMMR